MADPGDRVQRLILTAEMVMRRETEVAESIPHVVAAIRHCTDMLKEVFGGNINMRSQPKNVIATLIERPRSRPSVSTLLGTRCSAVDRRPPRLGACCPI